MIISWWDTRRLWILTFDGFFFCPTWLSSPFFNSCLDLSMIWDLGTLPKNTINILVQCKDQTYRNSKKTMAFWSIFSFRLIRNTITFVDENRRFVTTSDDKTIRAWDFDIPVVIKYIAEPAMHSMPAVGIHPNSKFNFFLHTSLFFSSYKFNIWFIPLIYFGKTDKWLAMQSLDNQILIYSSDSFKQNRKKRFAGHTIAGYACEVGFSPDGRFLSSGDGNGSMVFWDWKSCRISKRLKCHDQVVISHAWLPHETVCGSSLCFFLYNWVLGWFFCCLLFV